MATKKKPFKPHPMYSKSGKMVMAKTMKDHLNLKKKGYSHTKPKTKKNKKEGGNKQLFCFEKPQVKSEKKTKKKSMFFFPFFF